MWRIAHTGHFYGTSISHIISKSPINAQLSAYPVIGVTCTWMYIIFTAYSCYWIKPPHFFPQSCRKVACLHYLFLRVEWCGFNPANRRDNSFFPGFTSSVYFRRGAYLTHSECSVCMRHAGNAAAVCWPLIPHQWRAVFLEWWVWDERLFCKEVKVIIWKKLHWQWLEFTLPSSG